MSTGWSQRVRQVAVEDYVQPARVTGSPIRIRFGDLKAKMLKLGFPPQNANQIASPLESKKFWKPLGLEMCSPRGQSRKVDTVFEFKFADGATSKNVVTETPEEKAFRLTERMRGLLKEEIAAFGGTEAFMRWVRSDDDEQPA